MRDGIVRADALALAAFDALGLIDHGFSVDDGNGALRADRRAGMRHASAAVVRDLIHIGRTRRARRGNDLHQRRFVIFVRNVASAKAAGKVHGLIFGPQRKAHRKAHALRTDGALAPDALAVQRFIARRDLVRDRLDGVFEFALFRFEGDARHLHEHLPAQFFQRSQQSSFHSISKDFFAL